MQNLKDRRITIVVIISSILLLFIGRLFFLQVLSTDYAALSQDNIVKKVVLNPARGILYDRNGQIIVTNKPIYDLKVTPKELYIQDSSIFDRYLNMPRKQLRQKIQEARDYSMEKPSLFIQQISGTQYARLQEHLWKCDGLNTVVRNTRKYRVRSGANFLGYINEVDSGDIRQSSFYYDGGDYAGRSGLERYYEQYLRGDKGVRMLLRDVHGREVGSYADGKLDTMPEKGLDVMLSIDAKLQGYGEKLMRGKRGAIVAIEPASGEILSCVSAPAYDPNLLSGNQLGENFIRLRQDSLKPLYNRAITNPYPPGSTFKPIMAATALQEGTLTPTTHYGCAHGFLRNGGRPGCHGHPSPLEVEGAVQHSCNAFFAGTYVDMLHNAKYGEFIKGFRTWYSYMHQFGLGSKLGVDLPNENPGNIPSESYYNDIYGEGRWKGMTIVSNAIGQGEILMTPLQMANMAAIFANRGHYVQPHFFKRFFNEPNEQAPTFQRNDLPIDTAIFWKITRAMEKVVSAGTGYGGYIDDIPFCGKTGTSENPHGKDHSVFIAFAPAKDPKIAIAVVVENAGYGGQWAAPIASLMIEQYIRGNIADRYQYRENYIIDKHFFEPRDYLAPPEPGDDDDLPQDVKVAVEKEEAEKTHDDAQLMGMHNH